MVCFRQSEWSVEFSHLKSEIDTFLDKGINKEEDEGIKNILIERKNEALQITEAKVNALSFWKEVKVSGNSMPEGVTYEPHTNSCRKMHSWETEPILQPGESPSTLEQFPTNNKVYHFHPNMFVRQMKRITAPSMLPWMEMAIKEYNEYQSKGEKESPLKERIFDYFDISSFTAGNNRTHWCGAFVNWCLKKSNFKTPAANAAARSWSPKGAYEYYWEGGEKSNIPFVGAITLINWKGGGQHVAFVIGETKQGRIVILGGNQGGHEGGGITLSSALKSEIQFYMSPKGYRIPSSAYDLPVRDIADKLTYSNTH